MRSTRLVALVALAGSALQAQVPAATPSKLSLEEAISIARRNNPLYLETANDRDVATANVRAAYANLVPSLNSSLSASYDKAGTQFLGGASISASADTRTVGYQLGVNYSVNTGTLLGPKLARANRDATDADITGAAEQLRATVTQQYIAVLAAEANADLQDTLVITAQSQLDLARARVAVGAATILDIRRAEVALGQAQVSALSARNAVQVEKLRLFQQLGVQPPASGDVILSTSFAVQTPGFKLDSLLDIARRQNPALNALRSRENASGVAVRQRQGQYAPTLSLSTGIGGRSFGYMDADYLAQSGATNVARGLENCQQADSIRVLVGLPSYNCNTRYQWNDQMAAAARASNSGPFQFQRAPMSISARLSLPIFDNFQREQSVEQAQVQREDARYQVRARELQLNTDVGQAYLNLVTAARTVEMQEQNAQKAREELTFAEERYRVGAATFLDVITSRSTFVQAQSDRLRSIYTYHQSFAALESAVGRPLR
jgi:outer membrane protein